ncbi:Williams-Beuren syndrome chromosomal region 27 protein, partial [Plakobranchus ocellatus]
SRLTVNDSRKTETYSRDYQLTNTFSFLNALRKDSHSPRQLTVTMATDETTPSLQSTQEVDKVLLRRDITYQESQQVYKQWADNGTYDKMIDDNPKEYNGLIMFAEGMAGLFSDVSEKRVLDLGAGTGLSGIKLRSVGYVNIDALEPLESFVETCKKKGIYRSIIQSPIGGEKPLDVPNDTYDAVCTTGTFGPGHIPCSAIPEIVRILKPGGCFLNCMRAEYLLDVPEYKDRLVPLLEELEGQGLIMKEEWTVYPNHFTGKDGIRMVYRKLQR